MSKKRNLKEIAGLFLKLGVIAFGGPAAHIAMMEDEVVKKRRWMSREHFLDLLGATNLIPGPNSTEMAIHCGFHRGGILGLIIAGVCFIVPACLITGIIAYFYFLYGSLPEVEPFLYGIKPAVIAIIIAAVISLGEKALSKKEDRIELGLLGVLAVIAVLAGISEIAAILSAGLFGMLWLYLKKKKEKKISGFFAPLLVFMPAVPHLSLFWTFLKIGAVLFGSGYVLIAYLEGIIVNELGWITSKQLLDAVAIGQFTPGPVLSTATFIGYLIGGSQGAIIATIGIFLPSFVFVLITNPLIPKLRKSLLMSCFLDAVNVASVGIIAAVLIQLGINVFTDWKTILIAVIGFVLTFKFKLNAAWIVLLGAVAGFLLYLIG